MKQRILFTVAFLMVMAAAASTATILTTAPLASTQEGVAIDESNFPDANFRQYVLNNFDSDHNSILSTAEAEAVEEINVEESSISDLTGIGFFKKLKVLVCNNTFDETDTKNHLTALDVSQNTELIRLACGQNEITSLDLSHNVNLENLHCGNNKLTTIDVSHQPNLWRFYCSGNQLTTIDVSHNPELTDFRCFKNQLTSINVTGCSKLDIFFCYENNLTSIDVTNCSQLEYFYCYYNNLTSLEMTHNEALQSLVCCFNSLTNLDVSGCPQLRELKCYYNELTTLDVSHNPNLTELYCFENKIVGAGMDALIESLVESEDESVNKYLIFYNYASETEQNVCTKKQVEDMNKKGWIALLYYWGELYYYEAPEEEVEVVTVSDLADYTGNATYVYNEADGKIYVLNNLNKYEEYGIYEKSATLKVAEGDREIEYIETKTDGNHPYINTGYIFKENTRVIVECDLTENNRKSYEAVFGARHDVLVDAFVFFSRFSGNNSGCWVRNQEVMGNVTLPMNQRITIDVSGNKADIYKSNSTEPYTTITCTGSISSGKEEMYIFDLNHKGNRDNSWAFMKLYSFKIYEGETLVMNLKPIVGYNGKGGLVDKVSGQRFFSADPALEFSLSPDGEDAANNPGITVYEGKLVVNTTDGNLYKYTNGAFTSMGKVTLTPIAATDYKDLRNWQTNDAHKSVFEGKIVYDEQNDLNKVDNYVGIANFEPLMTRIPTTRGDDYNFSFVYSGSSYTSWHNVEMHAYVTNAYNLSTEESAQVCGGNILATCALPFGGANNMNVSMDFTAAQNTETLVYQFGDVADGNKGYWFHFGHLLVQKYNYPVTYPSLMDIPKGDVNGDGTVSTHDIVVITNVIAGITTNAGIVARSDVNDDGTVDISDIIAITNILMGN